MSAQESNSVRTFFNSALIVTFFAMISLPAVFTHTRETSSIEKRQLARFPDLKWDLRTVKDFPAGFDKFFRDHFGFRDELVYAHSLLNLKIGTSPSPRVIVGKDGWLFYAASNDGDPVSDYLGRNLFTDSELERFRADLEAKYYELKKRNIDYVYTIAPNKHTIYGEYMPYRFRRAAGRTRYDQLVEYMRSSEVPVLDLREVMLRGKNEARDLYYRIGTHWNAFGAAVAQYEIAEYLSRIDQAIEPKRYRAEMFETKVGIGDKDLPGLMNLERAFDATAPVLVEGGLGYRLEALDWERHGLRRPGFLFCTINDNCASKLHAIVFRDSFFTALQPYISRYFARVTYVWKQMDFDTFEALAAEMPVDVVIEERAERYLRVPPPIPAPK